MTGSEKQIKWATDIINLIKDMMDYAESSSKDNNLIAKAHEIHTNIIDNMNKSYAGYIIEDFRELQYEKGDMAEKYKSFATKLNLAKNWSGRNYRENICKE